MNILPGTPRIGDLQSGIHILNKKGLFFFSPFLLDAYFTVSVISVSQKYRLLFVRNAHLAA